MRANPTVRAITAATALSLAISSVAAAQSVDEEQLVFAESMPSTLGAVVTNALDPGNYNALVTGTAKSYHSERLGGRDKPPVEPKKNANKQPPPGGWIERGPVEGTDTVTQAALSLAGEESPNLMLVSGGDWTANVGIARLNPSTTILDLNAPTPCLDESGRADASAECIAGAEAAPGNYRAIEFAVEEGAYLAGVIAARESRGMPLGIISGALDCLECDRYVTGFINGARSVEPEIEIELAYLADDEVAGFGDGASAKTYAEAFIEVYQPGVLLPIGRGATMGMVEAACEADVKVIGAGIDISAERPDFRQSCVMTSIVPDVARAVEEGMYYFSTGGGPPVITYDLSGGGVTMTEEWFVSPTKRVDTNEFFDAAKLAIQTDQVEPCPDGCGVFAPEPDAEDVAVAG
ncbi:MAG: BMP family ABC transporter substrate-binding protein [Candidatus Limnocylindrales bacterium]